MAKKTTPPQSSSTDTPPSDTPEATPKKSAKPATGKKAAASKTAKKPRAAAKSGDATEKKPAGRTRAKNAAEPSQEDIARRAYEIHQARGGAHGYHEDDWHQAEAELRGKGKKTRTSK